MSFKFEPDNLKLWDVNYKRLDTFLKKETIPHALLFSGIEGIGKRSTAMIFAMACNCKGEQQANANSQQPAASSQQPTANSQQPTANSQQPTASSQQPTANSQQPTAKHQTPAPANHAARFDPAITRIFILLSHQACLSELIRFVNSVIHLA